MIARGLGATNAAPPDRARSEPLDDPRPAPKTRSDAAGNARRSDEGGRLSEH